MLINHPQPSFVQGFAYVEFGTKEALEAAIVKSGTLLNGKHINVVESQPPGPTPPGTRSGANNTPLGVAPNAAHPQGSTEGGNATVHPLHTDQRTAFVKSIGGGTSDDELREMFAGCGEVTSLRHMRDSQGETRVSGLTHSHYSCLVS